MARAKKAGPWQPPKTKVGNIEATIGSVLIDHQVGGRPGCVELHVDLIDQRVEIVGFTVWNGVRPVEPDRRSWETVAVGGPQPLSAVALRVPFAQIVDEHRAAIKASIPQTLPPELHKSALRSAAGRGQARRKADHAPEHWQTVAEIYVAAWRDRRNPRQAVADHFHVSTSLAGRWIWKVRNELNLLPPTVRGRAGARTPTGKESR